MIGACKSSRLANQKDNFPISRNFADARRVIRFNFPKMRKSVFPAACYAEISNSEKLCFPVRAIMRDFPKLNLPDDRGAIIGNFPKLKQENSILQNNTQQIIVLENDLGAMQKSDDFKNDRRENRKSWYLKTIMALGR